MPATATWDPISYGFKLQSSFANQIGWWRVTNWPDGRVLSVSVGVGNPILDTLVPLSPAAVHTYYATNQLGSQQSVVVTAPELSSPILSIPSDPTTQAVAVVVQTQREWTVTGRTAVYEILGRNVPYVEPLAPIERRGQLVLRMDHPGGGFPAYTLDHVRDMVKTGKPLLLRTVCVERVESLSFIVESVTETHQGQPNKHGPDRLMDFQWRAVEPLYGDDVAVAKRLWFQVPLEFATWNDVANSGLTWDELAFGEV